MMNIAQAVAQAIAPAIEAGRSGVSVFLDAGLIGLILTNSGLLIKALTDRKVIKTALETAALAVKREKDSDIANGQAENPMCQKHGEAIAGLVQFKGSSEEALRRIEGKVDRLLERHQ